MTKARKYFGALALISGATLSLVACGNNKHTNSSNANKTVNCNNKLNTFNQAA